MATSLGRHHVTVSDFFRNAAAAVGAVIAADWLVLLILEAVRRTEWIPNIWSVNQAAILAVVFASYVIGWRHPLIGAALSLGGTAIFFLVGYASVKVMPPLPAAWFAAPGLLYLTAWLSDRRHQSRIWF
jgi:hypothetical protein